MQAARGASLNSSDTTPQAGHVSRAPRRSRFLLVFAGIAGVGYAVDVATKVLAVEHLTGRAPQPLVGDLLTLYLARNPGAAFSTGTSYTLVLSCLALVAACVVVWVARRLGSMGWAIGLGFLLAGILGNLTDRVFRTPGMFRGHVVDFLRLPHWPIFNVADVCINIAAGVIILQALRGMPVGGRRVTGTVAGPDPDGPPAA
jgi:signal peptidase II